MSVTQLVQQSRAVPVATSYQLLTSFPIRKYCKPAGGWWWRFCCEHEIQV